MSDIEEKFVKSFYNEVAEEWNHTDIQYGIQLKIF